MKSLIWVLMTIGGYAGAYVPMLWGDSGVSYTSVAFSFFGGLLGIWLGFKLGQE